MEEANYNGRAEGDSAEESVANTSEDAGTDDAVIELIASGDAAGERLDKWLAARLRTYSRSRLQQWIEAGAVEVNGAAASMRQPVWGGDRISVRPQESADETAFRPEALALEIVHEDETILVLDKPAGVVVHPAAGNWTGTLLNGLLHHAPQLAGVPRAGIVHRLDKDTSGLMVVAKTLAAQTDLVRQLQARTVGREYLALVHGSPPERGAVDAAIGRHSRDRVRMAVFPKASEAIGTAAAKPALTRFRVLRRFDVPVENASAAATQVALVCCKLATGRTHQIRVHMQSLGFPLVGDALYGKPRGRPVFGRQALHAWRLGLVHPDSGRKCAWTVAPPEDFMELLQALGLLREEFSRVLERLSLAEEPGDA